MRISAIVCVCLLSVACAGAVETPSSPSQVSSFSSVSVTPDMLFATSDPIGDRLNTCPDIAPIWLVKNSETDAPSFNAVFSAVNNVDTYQVEVAYSQDGVAPRKVFPIRSLNGTTFTVSPVEGSGRYYVKVRVKNRCDRTGTWSTELTVYMGNDDSAGHKHDEWCWWWHGRPS